MYIYGELSSSSESAFGCLGSSLGSPGALWAGFGSGRNSVDFCGWPKLSSTAYSDKIWPTGKNLEKSVPEHMCFSIESCFGGAPACTGAPRPSPSPQPVHNTKMSLEVASSEVTRIAARSAFLELVAAATGATGAAEVVSRTVAQTPPPMHAGGQDDGSYTNSLKT